MSENNEIRQLALQMANNHHEQPEDVVKRAKAYMDFFDPPITPVKKRKGRRYTIAHRKALAERMRNMRAQGIGGRKPKLVA